jgi:hypothetical protein
VERSFSYMNLIKTPLSGSEVKIDPKELWEYPLKERTNSDSDLDTLVDKFKNQRLSRACIVHLVIKKNNWSYVKTISCVILELRST